MSAAHSLPAQKMPPSSAGKKPPSDNDRLMAEIGSELGFDPFPPEHYLCYLNAEFSITPKALRVMACLYTGTIRKKRGGRTGSAKTESGQHMGRTYIAESLGVTSVSAEIRELAQLGLIRIDKHGHFWLCGKVVPQAPAEPDSDESEQDPEGRTEGEEEPLSSEERKFCTRFFPKYKWLRFQQLNKIDRHKVQCLVLGSKSAYDRVLREVTETLREMRDQMEDSKLAEFGFEPRRNKESKALPTGEPVAELRLRVDWENLVQNSAGNPVQGPEDFLYNDQNGLVQNSPPYISSEVRDTEKTLSGSREGVEDEMESSSSSEQSPPATPTTTIDEPTPAPKQNPKPNAKPSVESEDDRRIVAEAVMQYAVPDRQAIVDLIRKSRRAAPDVTAAEIAAAIHQKAPLARGPRPVGFLLAAVPVMFADGGLELIRGHRKPASEPDPASPIEQSSPQVADELRTFLAEFPTHPSAPRLRRELEEFEQKVARV